MLMYLALLFSLFSEFDCDLSLNDKNTTHTGKNHLVLNVSWYEEQIFCLFWPFFQAALGGFVVLVVQFKEGSLENHHLESIHSLHTA